MRELSYWNHNVAYYPWVRRSARGCGRVLDVGCGTGELAFFLASDGHEVVGIDTSQDCINTARARAAGTSTTFLATSLEDLDSTEGSFDAVVFVASLHHMDMVAAVAKAKLLLANDGALVVVGLATPSSPLDHVIEALRVVPSWVSSRMHKMRSSEDLGIPTSYDMPTMAHVREVASILLPGASMRYGLHWRYLLVWRKIGGISHSCA